MFYKLLFTNNIFLLLISNVILDMTFNNPIFILSIITVVWFIPGILVRRINEVKQKKKKDKNQADAIKKLYPNSKDFLD